MLGVIIPVWQRPDLTRRVLSYWGSTRFAFCHRVVVLSPEDQANHIIPNAFDVVWESNNNRQQKWQAGLDAMPETVDSVMIMGSDDLATPELVQELHAAAYDNGVSYPGSIYFADVPTKRIMHPFFRIVFAGATFRRDVITSSPNPFFVRPDHPTLAPDQAAMLNSGRPYSKPGIRVPNCDKNRIIVDIKTDTNVWSYNYMYERVARKGVLLPALSYDDLFNTHFGGFWDE